MGDLVLGDYIRWEFILLDFNLRNLVLERNLIYLIIFLITITVKNLELTNHDP